MYQENEQQNTWWDRLKHNYRLVVMNNETFEEIGSYRLTLLNVYILLSTVIVVVALIVVALIAFTPLKRYIPGYGDIQKDDELREVYQTLEEIEKLQEAQDVYTSNVKRMLVGDVETENDIDEAIEQIDSSEMLKEVERSEIDEQLRQEIELEEIGEIAQRDRMINFGPCNTPLERMYFTAPVSGEISAGFMPDKDHFGVDILAPRNTAIKSIMDGYVFISDWTLETGNTIGIQHTNNVISFYKHNSLLLKKVGSYVKAGEAVAIIGNTGDLSDGPHLHFELWHKGKPIDPVDYVQF